MENVRISPSGSASAISNTMWEATKKDSEKNHREIEPSGKLLSCMYEKRKRSLCFLSQISSDSLFIFQSLLTYSFWLQKVINAKHA